MTNTDTGLLVKPEVARTQMDAETSPKITEEPKPTPVCKPPTSVGLDVDWPEKPEPLVPRKPKRYHGSVTLDSTRAVRDASEVIEHVITHITGLPEANVKLTLEIEAEIPDGAPENVVRTVTENSRTLNFNDSGFEDR